VILYLHPGSDHAPVTFLGVGNRTRIARQSPALEFIFLLVEPLSHPQICYLIIF